MFLDALSQVLSPLHEAPAETSSLLLDLYPDKNRKLPDSPDSPVCLHALVPGAAYGSVELPPVFSKQMGIDRMRNHNLLLCLEW